MLWNRMAVAGSQKQQKASVMRGPLSCAIPSGTNLNQSNYTACSVLYDCLTKPTVLQCSQARPVSWRHAHRLPSWGGQPGADVHTLSGPRSLHRGPGRKGRSAATDHNTACSTVACTLEEHTDLLHKLVSRARNADPNKDT